VCVCSAGGPQLREERLRKREEELCRPCLLHRFVLCVPRNVFSRCVPLPRFPRRALGVALATAAVATEVVCVSRGDTQKRKIPLKCARTHTHTHTLKGVRGENGI